MSKEKDSAPGGELSPVEKYNLMMKKENKKILNIFTTKDRRASGLLKAGTIRKVLLELPGSMATEDVLKDQLPEDSSERVDYAKFCSSARVAGLRVENKQRGGPSTTPVKVKLPKASDLPPRGSLIDMDTMRDVRQKINESKKSHKAEKSDEEYVLTKTSLKKGNYTSMNAQSKQKIKDAFMAYSTSTRSTEKAFKELAVKKKKKKKAAASDGEKTEGGKDDKEKEEGEKAEAD